MNLNILTKTDIEKKLKELKKELSEDINKNIDKKFKDKEEEKTRLEKEAIKKQGEKPDKAWNKVKNKDLRLSEIEHKIINIEEFLNSSALRFNEMVNKFNQHIENNNNKFDILAGKT